MSKGDLILITFPFTDLSGSKLRPAVVLAARSLDLTVCFVTSQLHGRESTDITLAPDAANGLKLVSLIRTSKIATLDRSLAKGLLGRINKDELFDLDSKLKLIFQIS